MQNKLELLTQWAEKKNIQQDKLSRVFKMLCKGRRSERTAQDPIQFPSCFLEDDLATPWHEPEKYFWVELLKKNFEDIKKEAITVFRAHQMQVHPENGELAGDGTWNTFFFYKNAEVYTKNLNKCPATAAVLKQIPGVEMAGRTYFSAMTPGIHIKPHCGPHNFKLRTHLGLVTSPQAKIRVGDSIRSWEAGSCLVFDDSYEHEVWNHSGITRIVLIVDVWNPILTSEEIEALKYIMPEFYNRAYNEDVL